MKQPELKICIEATDQLVPYVNNSKIHDEAQINFIVASIQEFGNCDPIAVWHNAKGEAEIVEGHGRLLALKKLGIAQAPVIYLDHLTDEQRRAYSHVHNQTTLNSGLDFSVLEIDFNELDGFDWESFGFDDPFKFGEEDIDVVEDDDIDDAESRVKPGDVWQLGGHRLMCGDASSADDMATLMAGDLADCVFTDPPYGVAIGDKNKTLNSVTGSQSISENITGDTLTEEDLYELLVGCFANIRGCCKDDASYYVTSPPGGSLGLMMLTMMRDAGLPVRHVLMWRKNSATFSLGRLDYDYQHEPIFYTWTDSHHNYRRGKFRTTVWDIPKPHKCDLHPTMKPVELVANVLADATVQGDIVLDAFSGSGTTIIAAEQMGQRAYCMEIDPHYCDVILARYEAFTGKTAVRI